MLFTQARPPRPQTASVLGALAAVSGEPSRGQPGKGSAPEVGLAFRLRTPCADRQALQEGMLHTFSNASKDLYKVLSNWDAVYKSLKTLEPLVTNKDRLKKFVYTCMANSPHPQHLFRSTANHLYDKRWGEVYQFCRWLRCRLPVLRDT